jgi:ribosome-associated protein
MNMMTRILLLFVIPSLTCAWMIVTPTTTLSVRHLESYSSSSSSLFLASSVDKDSDAMVNFMNQPPLALLKQSSSDKPILVDSDVMDMVITIVQAADGRKANDIVALHVEACTSLCDVIIICSGNSRPQNQAIAKAIQEKMLSLSSSSSSTTTTTTTTTGGNPPTKQVLPEGTADSGWMLLDYATIMVHIMTPKSRLYYNMEGQWVEKGGHYIALEPHLMRRPTTTLPQQQQQQGSSSTMEHLTPNEDPFWS